MIGIIIQARMGSTRLPGKVLKNIGNKSLLEHIFFRLEKLEHPANIVVATSNNDRDDSIAAFCDAHHIECFRGSESNVLERYYTCAKQYGFSEIIRLTGDNPFVDAVELDRLITLHQEEKADYSTSLAYLPKGVGAEIFTFNALERSFFHATHDAHFEHVNEYILDNEKHFRISKLILTGEKNRPDLSLTVDTQEDLEKVCFIAKQASGILTTEKAIKLCLRFA